MISNDEYHKQGEKRVAVATKRSRRNWIDVLERWMLENALTVPDWSTVTSEYLAKLLLSSIKSLRTLKGKEYAQSSLAVYPQAVLSYCGGLNGEKWDLYNDEQFIILKNGFNKHLGEMQARGVGRLKQAGILTSLEWSMIIEDCDISTPKGLARKVYFSLARQLAMRGPSFYQPLPLALMKNIQKQIVTHPVSKNVSERQFIEIPSRIDKNHPGGFKFIAIDNSEKIWDKPGSANCAIRLIKLYLSKCPPNLPEDARFFLQPETKTNMRKNPKVWYKTKGVGRNWFNNQMSDAAESCKIDKNICSHSGRRSNTTRLHQMGYDNHVIKKKTHHLTDSSISRYNELSDATMCKVADDLQASQSPIKQLPLKPTDTDTGDEFVAITKGDPMDNFLSPPPKKKIKLCKENINPNTIKKFTFNNCNVNIF